MALGSGRLNRRAFFLISLVTVGLALAAEAVCASYPALSLKDLSGKQQSLSDFDGKIVVLNFWATWCGPCQDEMPMLNKLAGAYSDRGVVFLAVSIDDSKDIGKIPRFLEKRKISLPVWVGATPDILDRFELGKMIPATIILDRDGTAIGRIMGEARRGDITSRLDWALAGRPGEAPKPLVKHL